MSAPFLNREQIEARQLEQLRSLIAALIPSNSFYSNKLADCGFEKGVLSVSDFVSKCPFTNKQEAVDDQATHPPYGTNLTYPLERYTRCHNTSGSTGKPLRWLDTNETWDWMLSNWGEVFQAAAVTATDRIYFAFSFGPFLGFWTAFESALRIGALCLPGGGLSSAARLKNLIEQQATVLCCTPTYAIHLAQAAAREGIDLKQAAIKSIIVAGEPGGSLPATRKQISDAWNGARVFDHHGMTEVGPVTYECPAKAGLLHIIETSYLAEIINPDSEETLPQGETGELILTTLGRTGSPLLRYRTGDLVKSATAEQCECGRHELALEGGILGRVDDMVVVRGVNIYPGAVEQIIRSVGGVAEYQVKVDSSEAMTEIEVVIEPESGVSDADELVQRLSKHFENSFALRVPVRAAEPGSLPRFEMKAKRWVT